MNTIFLRPTTWDLDIDVAGNIALAGDPYALAQDAASEVRLFRGEYWYDTSLGIPYWETTLGKPLNLPLYRAQATAAAMSVPGVVAAQCFFTSADGRQLGGQIQITDSTDTPLALNFSR